jgi:hypothetical protein
MRNYLSQIANRARGIAETDHIKPTSQGWPVTRSEGVSDPFEEIEVVQNPPAQVPEANAEPLVADRVPDDVILPDAPGREKRAPDTPVQSYVPFEQPIRLSPRPSPDFAVPPPSHETEGEIIEHSGQDQSDRLPPHPVQENITASDMEDVPLDIDQPVPGDTDNVQYTKEKESVSHRPIAHSLPPGDLGLDTGDSMLDTRYQHPASGIQNLASSIQHPASGIQHPASSIQHPVSSIQQTDQDEREPLSELRPRPPISPVTSPVHRSDSQEKRLVIGRLRVEVVKPPLVTTQKRTVRIAPRRQQPQRESGISRSKLRFGLGQI